MNEGRNLRAELAELEIINLEGVGVLSQGSVFAAIDAIKEHGKNYSNDYITKNIERIKKETLRKIAGSSRSVM
ncbi:MAG: hypothetical protein LBT01_02710 [Spirochaetaceae bacterium]|nr:hypothetical protein [Spirochaetaceae bacterium]